MRRLPREGSRDALCRRFDELLSPLLQRPQENAVAATHKQISLDDALTGIALPSRGFLAARNTLGWRSIPTARPARSRSAPDALSRITGHDFIPLEEVTDPLQEQIVNYSINMSKKEETAKKAITTMDGTISQIDSRRTATEKEIDQAFDSVIASLSNVALI